MKLNKAAAKQAAIESTSPQFSFITFAATVIVLWLLAFSGIARAQDYSFSSVRVVGNEHVDPSTVIRYAGISAGQSVTSGQLNDALQRVQDSGLFESVSLDPQGSTLVVTVKEYPVINIVSFEGNRRLEDDKLQEIVTSQSRMIYSPSKAEADAQAIIDVYSSQGRMAATVNPKIIQRDGNRVDLVFEIQEGKVTEVERIAFVGNRAFSDRRLRQVLQTRQAGFLRSIITKDTYAPERIEFDKQALRDFYASRGYADFEVLDATVEMSRERDSFFVTFTVREGQQFRIGNVDTVSKVEGVDAGDFARMNRLRSGVVYNPVIIDYNIQRMENVALQQGLNFIRVDPVITRHEREGLLDITFTITKGPKLFVERIDIEGNTTTMDQVIRRQFRVAEGDPFNPREIRQAAERIKALDFFATSNVDTKPGSSPDQVIVDVNVEEKPTGSLTLGGTYSVSDGFGINIGLQETNFLGRGQSVGITVGTTSDETRVIGSFAEPAFLGQDLTFRTSISYIETNVGNNVSYDTTTGALKFGLVFPTGEYSKFDVHYAYTKQEVRNVDSDSSLILQTEEALGWQNASAPGYLYTYDTRGTGRDPLGGIILRFGQDFAGLGGNVTSITTNAYAGVERKIWNEDVTLRASIEGGVINMLGDETSIAPARYFGTSRLRGFESYGLGPRDLTAVNQDALGGNMLAVARIEAEFPIGLPAEYGIRGGLFLDTGSVWSLNDVNGTGGPVDDAFHLRATIGASLFLTTPIGPLRLNFMNAFIREDYDKPLNFDLSVSTTF